jgi:hypothetical protein
MVACFCNSCIRVQPYGGLFQHGVWLQQHFEWVVLCIDWPAVLESYV